MTHTEDTWEVKFRGIANDLYWRGCTDGNEGCGLNDTSELENALSFIRSQKAVWVSEERKKFVCQSCKHPLDDHWQGIGCDLYDEEGNLLDSCKHCDEDATY